MQEMGSYLLTGFLHKNYVMHKNRTSTSITSRNNLSLVKYFQDVNHIQQTNITQAAEINIHNTDESSDFQSILIKNNLRFVITIAKQYQYTGMPLEDLISEGNIGLIKASKLYHDQGYHFITYAVWWIRQAISKAVALNGLTIRLPANKIELLKLIYEAHSRIEQQFQREPTPAEIAEEIGISTEEVSTTLRDQSKQNLINAASEDHDFNQLDYLPGVEPGADSALDQESIEYALKKVLKTLSQRERIVLETNFGLGGCTPKSTEDIADCLNLTPQRVWQIKDEAILKLRSSATAYLKQHL
jgi:RNA polymerase primary sigma factor